MRGEWFCPELHPLTVSLWWHFSSSFQVPEHFPDPPAHSKSVKGSPALLSTLFWGAGWVWVGGVGEVGVE